MEPLVILALLERVLRREVLPPPEGPMMARSSPGSAAPDRSLRICFCEVLLLKKEPSLMFFCRETLVHSRRRRSGADDFTLVSISRPDFEEKKRREEEEEKEKEINLQRWARKKKRKRKRKTLTLAEDIDWRLNLAEEPSAIMTMREGGGWWWWVRQETKRKG